MALDLTASAILAAAALAATLLFGWLGARPAKPLAAPRLAPWRLMMLVVFALAVAVLSHMVAIWRAA
jgi:hypothetical protein